MNTEYSRIVRLAVLGSIAILPLLILPTMIGSLVDMAGFTESQAGWAAAAGGAGGALSAIVIALRIHHLDIRKLALFGLLALALCDFAAVYTLGRPIGLFMALRFMSGIGGAAAYAAVMASYAALPNSERGYGVFMMFQFALSALGLYFLPMALPSIGVGGLFTGMALLALSGLALIPAVNSGVARIEESSVEIHMLIRPAAILIMLGIGLFETANNMHFTYAERIGVDFGLGHLLIGEVLGISTLLGIPAAFAAVWLGDRHGELKPILAALSLAVFGLTLLLAAAGATGYTIAMCALSVAWAFGLPYFQAFEARLDPGGSVVVAGGFFTAAGGAAGPALAALLVAPGDYSGILLASIALYAVVGLVVTASNAFYARG